MGSSKHMAKRRPSRPKPPIQKRRPTSTRGKAEAAAKEGAADVAALIGDFSALDAVDYVRRCIQREGVRLGASGEGVTPKDRRMILESMGRMVQKLGEITGETLEIPDSKWCKLPSTKRMTGRIVEALRPFPEAARAVLEVLEAVG